MDNQDIEPMSKKERSDAPLQVSMLLYVLECEPIDDKPTWYIGVSYALNNRIAQHTSGRGSAWVKLHPVVRIAEVRMNASLEMERQATLDYMRRYGWEHVRGGPYSKPFMRRPPKELRDDLPPQAEVVVRRESHVSQCSYAKALTRVASQADEPVGVLEV